MADTKRELPLVKRRIEALLKKTEANGCTPGEAAAALGKAKELVAKYELDPDSFRWPVAASTASDAATSGPSVPKPPQSSGASRGRGIGKLAEQLIVEHPDWTYAAIAAEVNRRIDGAHASAKSVRWYASRMRKRGEKLARRRGTTLGAD